MIDMKDLLDNRDFCSVFKISVFTFELDRGYVNSIKDLFKNNRFKT